MNYLILSKNDLTNLCASAKRNLTVGGADVVKIILPLGNVYSNLLTI